jgi:hypothetical protein
MKRNNPIKRPHMIIIVNPIIISKTRNNFKLDLDIDNINFRIFIMAKLCFALINDAIQMLQTHLCFRS